VQNRDEERFGDSYHRDGLTLGRSIGTRWPYTAGVLKSGRWANYSGPWSQVSPRELQRPIAVVRGTLIPFPLTERSHRLHLKPSRTASSCVHKAAGRGASDIAKNTAVWSAGAHNDVVISECSLMILPRLAYKVTEPLKPFAGAPPKVGDPWPESWYSADTFESSGVNLLFLPLCSASPRKYAIMSL
jgi:hypothetical protein